MISKGYRKQEAGENMSNIEEKKDECSIVDAGEAGATSDEAFRLLTGSDLHITYNPTPILNWDTYLEMEKMCFKDKMKQRVASTVTLKDFEFILHIGCGNYGKVLLAQKKDTKAYYAVKIISKKTVMEKNVLLSILSEKHILDAIRFPFTIYMEYFFQNTKYIFFVLPLAIAGDLSKYLQLNGKMNEQNASFYAGQVLLALEYLHYMNLIYRDLKPSNILLDHLGFLKIADFGLCKYTTDKCFTICGTPSYVAPEVLKGCGYDNAVDWWSFGVFIYELCAGYTPFGRATRKSLYNNIAQGKFTFPKHFRPSLHDLIWHLLDVNVSKRYGSADVGVKIIKNHKWFQDIHWLPLLNRQIQPPFLPKVSLSVEKDVLDIHSDEDTEMSELQRLFQDF